MKSVLAWLVVVLALSSAARADEVVMAVARSLPPYVIAETWGGLEYDVVKEALALEGHTIRAVQFCSADLIGHGVVRV